MPDYSPDAKLTPRQQSLLFRVCEVLEQEPVNTPNAHRISQQLSIPIQAVEAILKLGVQTQVVIKIDETVYYTPKQILDLQATIREWADGRSFSHSDLREKLAATRKYTTPLIDYFDTIGFTTGPSSEKTLV